MRNAGLQFSFALAKGRGRYLCLSRLDMLLQEGQAQSATAQMFEEKRTVRQVCQRVVHRVVQKFFLDAFAFEDPVGGFHDHFFKQEAQVAAGAEIRWGHVLDPVGMGRQLVTFAEAPP